MSSYCGVAIGLDDGSVLLSEIRPRAAWGPCQSLLGEHLRSEVGISISRYDEPEVHEAAEEELVVAETVHDVSEGDWALEGRLALVLLEAKLDIFSFPFSKPLSLLGETWDDLVMSEAPE